MKWVSAILSLSVGRLAMVVVLLVLASWFRTGLERFRSVPLGCGHSDSRARVSAVAGWAGSSSRVAIAAAALTPAATRQAALKPWKNALEAAAWTAFARAGWPLRLVRLASWSAPPTELWAVRASRGASAAGSLSLSRLL